MITAGITSVYLTGSELSVNKPRVLVTSARGALDYVMRHFCEPGVSEYPEESDSYAVISIQDTKDGGFGYELKENRYCKAVLTVYFDDIEKPQPGLKMMSHSQAEEIVEFIRAHSDDADTLLIHCFAGISRSAAVGMTAREILGQKSDKPEFFNRYVYEELLKCL